MTVVRIDPDAHLILRSIRDEMKNGGITGATFSDAVRLLGAHYTEDELIALGESYLAENMHLAKKLSYLDRLRYVEELRCAEESPYAKELRCAEKELVTICE